MRRVDLVGQTIGVFKVLKLDEELTTKKQRSHFICICNKCLKECVVSACEIKRAKSCGCEKGVGDWNREAYGIKKTHFFEYRLLSYARRNSRRRGEECDLVLEDIVIPEYCPLLGIKLETCMEKKRRKGPGSQDSCPSVDRIDSKIGYIKDNIWIISKRANVIKNNATVEELGMIYEGLLQRMK
jgi:hypothetical protein